MSSDRKNRLGLWLAILAIPLGLAAVGCQGVGPAASVVIATSSSAAAEATDNAADDATDTGANNPDADEAIATDTAAAEATTTDAATSEPAGAGASSGANATAGEAEGPRIPPVLLTTSHKKLCWWASATACPTSRCPSSAAASRSWPTCTANKPPSCCSGSPIAGWAEDALIDLATIAKAADPGKVSMVGIAVAQRAGAARTRINKTGATFPQLLDADSKAFSQIGAAALPRVYVLDTDGKIVWFDIEYSEATRRELRQTLDVLTGSTE